MLTHSTKPMKRTAFKPKGWTPKPATQSTTTARPKETARGRGEARMSVGVPKDVKAKPGKRTPNAAERAWMDAIVAHGCIACHIDGHGYTRPAVHHILRGGRRIGHLFTLPLCDPGHHQNGAVAGVVSRHPWKTQFESRYGSEMTLLDELRKVLA